MLKPVDNLGGMFYLYDIQVLLERLEIKVTLTDSSGTPVGNTEPEETFYQCRWPDGREAYLRYLANADEGNRFLREQLSDKELVLLEMGR